MNSVRWVRMDAAYDHHPDVRRAGFEGSVVFETLVRASSLYGLNGTIPAKYADPDYIADVRRWNATAAQAGIDACIRVGMLAMGDDGSVSIPGWDKYNNPSTLRSQAKRERDAMQRDATLGNAPGVAATPTVRNGTERDGTERDGSSAADARTRDASNDSDLPTQDAPGKRQDAPGTNGSASDAPEGGSTHSEAPSANVAHEDEVVLDVFNHWLVSCGLPPRTTPPEDKYRDVPIRQMVVDRLDQELSVDDLKHAIDGCLGSKRHRDKGVTHWGQILWSLTSVQEFLALANVKGGRRGPPAKVCPDCRNVGLMTVKMNGNQMLVRCRCKRGEDEADRQHVDEAIAAGWTVVP